MWRARPNTRCGKRGLKDGRQPPTSAPAGGPPWPTARRPGRPSRRETSFRSILAPIVLDTLYLCRAVLVGQPPAEAKAALQAYLLAQEAGIGPRFLALHSWGSDAATADALKAHGFGDAFLRPIFHGVGLEHEEAPIPGGHAVIHGEEGVERVEAGMVLAIGNCGIYREGFGVRAEDTVWVGPDGPVPLTRHSKGIAV